MTDETRTFLSAAEMFADLVGRIDPATFDGPGLGEWDLRALVGHTSRSLVTVLTYLDQPADVEIAATPVEYYLQTGRLTLDPAAIVERGRQAGAALGDAPAPAVRDLLGQVRAKLASADLDGLVTTIVGGMRVRAYLPTRTFELVVHGLDIARATGMELTVPPDAEEEATLLATRIGLAAGRGAELLETLTGRRGGFSVLP